MSLFDLRSDPVEQPCQRSQVSRPIADWFRTKLGNIVLGDGRVEADWSKENAYTRGKTPNSSTAALNDLVAPKGDKPSKSAGQWNTGRIIANGNHLEHWLNGVKVLEIELQSDE